MNDRTSQIRQRITVLALLLCAVFLMPFAALAAMPDAVATPAVIDGKGKVREILRFNVSLTNTSKHLVTIYPWVTDFDPTSGMLGSSDLGGSSEKPLASSLARWIEVTRGSIDLLPGEQKEIPLTVQINLAAAPGVYHATLHLSQGSDRASAESNLAMTQDLPINIEVLEDINERLQLATFAPVKNIFSGKDASFEYRIENIGNRGEIPRGKVRIFDRDGREVAVVDANRDGARLEPSGSALLSSVWTANGEFGRYKAMLDLEYGSRGTLQDTVFFWVMPWGKLLSMFLSLILACVIVAVVLHSRMTAQRGAYAYAGVPSTKRSVIQRVREFVKRDEDDDEFVTDEGNDRASSVINEMRQVAIPHPVRSRLPSFDSTLPESTRLSSKPVVQTSPASHRVTLEKREKKQSPHHVLNLRK
jgi:hypothetical protein